LITRYKKAHGWLHQTGQGLISSEAQEEISIMGSVTFYFLSLSFYSFLFCSMLSFYLIIFHLYLYLASVKKIFPQWDNLCDIFGGVASIAPLFISDRPNQPQLNDSHLVSLMDRSNNSPSLSPLLAHRDPPGLLQTESIWIVPFRTNPFDMVLSDPPTPSFNFSSLSASNNEPQVPFLFIPFCTAIAPNLSI
jgi:hypothetical protein